MADLTGTSTLNKFGVPMGNGEGRGGILQPKYAWRFRARFVNFGPINGGVDLTQQVESITRPHFSQPRVSVEVYNSVSYFTSRGEWQEISLVVRDDVTNLTQQLCAYQLQKQKNHLEQTAFEAGMNYKFTTYIDTLSGDNDTVIDSWFLEGCMLTNFDENGFSYSNGNAFMRINMSISFDNATLLGGLMTDVPDSISGYLV